MNPSSWPQRIRIAIVALIATAIALFLGLYQWQIIDSIWEPIFGDGTIRVLTSDLSHEFTNWIRIPDAVLGAVAYLSDAIFALAGSSRRWQDRPWLVMIFGINVIPIGLVSFMLVISQGIIVKFWCTLCLITASLSLVLILLAYNEVWSSCIYLYEVKKRGSWKIFWHAFWGSSIEPHKEGTKTWARICEMVLGAWLILSYFILDYRDPLSFVAAGFIFLFALLSYFERLNKIHLCQVIPAALLFYASYSYPTPWLPMGLQNYIITALLLLIFMIIPTHANGAYHSKEQ